MRPWRFWGLVLVLWIVCAGVGGWFAGVLQDNVRLCPAAGRFHLLEPCR